MNISRRTMLALPLGAALAGCGTTAPTNSTQLSIAWVNIGMTAFPIFVAQQQGFFKAQGVTLNPAQIPSMGSGPKLTAAIQSGAVDVAIGAITDAFTLSRVNAYIRVISLVSSAFGSDVIASKHLEQQTQMTATSPLADKVKALVGKKVSVSAPGGATDALLIYLSRSYGLDSDRAITKVSIGSSPSAGLAALTSGRCDAVTLGVPTGQLCEAQGLGDIFISPMRGDVPALQGMAYGVAYALQSVIDAKPKAIQGFIRAIAQAEQYIHRNPEQAAALLGRFLNVNKKTLDIIVQTAMSSVPQSPQIDQHGYDIANDFHVKGGLIAIALPRKGIVADDVMSQALGGKP